MDSGLQPRKLKTLVKTRFTSNVIMFGKTLEFKATNLLCYGKQKILSLQQIPKAQMWTIVETVITSLNPVVIACVLNQSKGH